MSKPSRFKSILKSDEVFNNLEYKAVCNGDIVKVQRKDSGTVKYLTLLSVPVEFFNEQMDKYLNLYEGQSVSAWFRYFIHDMIVSSGCKLLFRDRFYKMDNPPKQLA